MFHKSVGEYVKKGDIILECDTQVVISPTNGKILYLEKDGSQDVRKIRMGSVVARIRKE